MSKLKNKKKISVLNYLSLALILMIVITSIYLKMINKYFTPILTKYAESETVMLSTFIINESIETIVKSNDIDNIIQTVTNDNNEIISVDFNASKINSILYDVTENIQKHIKYLEHNQLHEITKYDTHFSENGIVYYIPIGVLLDNPILSSMGPKIPVYASLIGDVVTNVKTDINEYGINNSLVKIYINVEMNEEVIMPFTTDKINVNKQILLGMKIINGIVPEYYGNGISLESPLVTNN